MKAPFRVAATLAAVFGITQPAAAQDAARLSLDEAVQIALARNPAVAQATLAAMRAAEDVATARTRLLPVFQVETQASRLLRPVDVVFPAGAFGTFAEIGPVPATETAITTPTRMTMLVNASVAQPLTGLARARLGVAQSRTTESMAQEEARAARLELVRQVRRAYYAVADATEALDATAANGRLLAELRRVVGNRIAQQVSLTSDGLDVDARLAQHEVAVLSLQHQLETSKERLNQLLGRDLDAPLELQTDWAAAPTADDHMADDASERPDVALARLRTTQAELGLRQARVDAWPDVNLVAQTYSPVNLDGAPRNVTMAGIQVKWEPFDWGRRARTRAALALDVRRAREAERDTAAAALLEIRQRRRAVDDARAALRAASVAEQAARERVRLRTVQYDTRAVLLADVLDSHATLADAASRTRRVALALLAARTDLDRALGKELEP